MSEVPTLAQRKASNILGSLPIEFDAFDIMFKDLFSPEAIWDRIEPKNVHYPVNIKETDAGYIIEMAAIGLDKNDVDIKIQDGETIVISSDKKEEVCDQSQYKLKKIIRKPFKYAFRISTKFDLEKSQAQVTKGLLTIFIPASKDKKPKNITVE